MPNFHHHPDGLIFVRTDKGIYQDTVANFLLDSGSDYDPKGITEQLYIPGVTHVTNGIPAEGDVSWPFGDEMIRRVEELLAAQDARRNPPLTFEQLYAQVKAEIYEYSDSQVDALGLLPGGRHGGTMASSIGFILAEVKAAGGNIALISEASQARIASEAAVQQLEPIQLVQVWATKHAEMVVSTAPVLARRAELLLMLDKAETPEDLEAIKAKLI